MKDATYAPANLGNLTTTTTRTHRCGPGGSYTFQVVATKDIVVTQAGTVADSLLNDLVIETESSASYRTDFLVSVEYLIGTTQKAVTIESADASVSSSPVDGVSTTSTSGAARFVARSTDGEVSVVEVAAEVVNAGTAETAKGYAEGTLAAHCNSQIESLIAGKTRESMDLWSTRNDSTGQYAWNQNCWGRGIANITCLSPYNTATGRGGGGVLITPRHAMYCHHLGYHPKVGSRVRYVTDSNQTEEAVVDAVAPHPLASGVVSPYDIVICKFDRDLTVPFAKTLPSNPRQYLPSVPDGTEGFAASKVRYLSLYGYVRTCHTNQHKRLATSFIHRIPGDFSGFEPIRQIAGRTLGLPTVPSLFLQYYPENPLGDDITTGDSGAPAFFLVNNELVLANVWTGIAYGFPYYTDLATINAMLDDLGGGYNLTEVDLSGFPSY